MPFPSTADIKIPTASNNLLSCLTCKERTMLSKPLAHSTHFCGTCQQNVLIDAKIMEWMFIELM